MRPLICPDCGGAVTPGLIYGTTPEPVSCLICWSCGWQTPAVYPRTRAERNADQRNADQRNADQRNADQRNATATCHGCGTIVTASQPWLLRAYCQDCYRLRRTRPLSAAAVQGRARRVFG
mgnify:CR=1 FL=1